MSRLRLKKAHQLKYCTQKNEQNVSQLDCQIDDYLHVKAHGRLHLFFLFIKISLDPQNKSKIKLRNPKENDDKDLYDHDHVIEIMMLMMAIVISWSHGIINLGRAIKEVDLSLFHIYI